MKGLRTCIQDERTALLLIGAALLLCAVSVEPALAYDGAKYGTICNNVLDMADGTFGAMLTAIAGIGAIIASAMGGFKAAWACVVVAVGGFILRGYMTLFFPQCSGG